MLVNLANQETIVTAHLSDDSLSFQPRHVSVTSINLLMWDLQRCLIGQYFQFDQHFFMSSSIKHKKIKIACFKWKYFEENTKERSGDITCNSRGTFGRYGKPAASAMFGLFRLPLRIAYQSDIRNGTWAALLTTTATKATMGLAPHELPLSC